MLYLNLVLVLADGLLCFFATCNVDVMSNTFVCITCMFFRYLKMFVINYLCIIYLYFPHVPVGVTLHRIYNLSLSIPRCESLAEILWQNRQQLKKLDMLQARLPIDLPAGQVNLLPKLDTAITGLLSSLVTR